MNGNQILRVVAYISVAIGIGVLVSAAWGFIAFGLMVLIDTAFLAPTIFKSPAMERGESSARVAPKRPALAPSETELSHAHPKA